MSNSLVKYILDQSVLVTFKRGKLKERLIAYLNHQADNNNFITNTKIVEIAEACDMSEFACNYNLRKLQEEGIIKIHVKNKCRSIYSYELLKQSGDNDG